MSIILRVDPDFTQGLVARYLFTSDASDSLGNFNAGAGGSSITYSSAGARLQKVGNSNHKLTFGADGNSSNLSTTLNDLSSTTGTISFWVKASTNLAADNTFKEVYVFGSYQGNAAGQKGPHFGYWETAPIGNYSVDNGLAGWHFFSFVSHTDPYEGADWNGDTGTTDYHHIVLTVNGTSIRMYKDGEITDSYTATRGWPIDSLQWELNGKAGSLATATYFDGFFKDLAVWTGRVLEDDEVRALYYRGHGGTY